MTTNTSGIEWIRQANARYIGRVEFRQVTMEIGSGRRVRTLRLRTLRQSDGLIARTVFCVMEPRVLNNINYVVTEHCGQLAPFDIQLYLPYVLGTLRNIPPNRRREGHLGSDFSYDDLRTWLYEEGHCYGDADLAGSMIRVPGAYVQGMHLLRHGSAPFDVWLDPADAFVHGIDYRSEDGAVILRQYRADALMVIDGVRIAGQMAMMDRVRNHLTTIRLERAWYNKQIDAHVFEPSFRRNTSEYLATL